MSGADYTMSINMAARMAEVELSYADFKPQRQVRADLESIIPNLLLVSIKRTYTEKAWVSAIQQMNEDESEIYVETTNGLERTNIIDLLSEQLNVMTI